ncbi:nitroreductase family protein [Luminiphilus syltensis NOR5-1B]|uniref:Nitroreductase family protein n=1 Tax=Luminiphilus syltensis NOR5-1B TaxID=565045 RepID=B8KXT0_9GAMM|nr:nitroreductase family protein [Luminiphilus syltensis NOR5-1B]
MEPGPDAGQLNDIFAAGLRAPDHQRLRPWHFVVVEGDRRAALGALFEESLLLRKPDASEAERTKALRAPLRAPVMIAGLLRYVEHPKVPRVEQAAAVACALYGMSLAANDLGFGGMWRTGPYAQDPLVISRLGGAPGDEVIGFLYLGTQEGAAKPLPDESIQDFVSPF